MPSDLVNYWRHQRNSIATCMGVAGGDTAPEVVRFAARVREAVSLRPVPLHPDGLGSADDLRTCGWSAPQRRDRKGRDEMISAHACGVVALAPVGRLLISSTELGK